MVSICTTFFNAGRYIHRLLGSCLNQTYRNIEIVIVDDASTDDSKKIIRKYMARDARIKYFKNDKRIALAESLLKVFNMAKGDFAMMLGADDWLSKNYIENGLHSFSEHPGIAGVVPDLTTLFEYDDNGVFVFGGRQHFPPGIHSAAWFMKRLYKPTFLYVSGYALVRNKDLAEAMDYCVKNYYHNPSQSIPEELREFFKRGFGTDSMLFSRILTRYKNFVFDDSLNYLKISHSKNQYFNLRWDSLSEILKSSIYDLFIYKRIYEFNWPEFYREMKIFWGAQALSSALIYFFKYGIHSSLNFTEKNKKTICELFNEFSFFEIMMVMVRFILITINRCCNFVRRKFLRKNERIIEESSIFVPENFLDSERHFKAC